MKAGWGTVLRLIRARFKVWRCLMVKSIASALPIISTGSLWGALESNSRSSGGCDLGPRPIDLHLKASSYQSSDDSKKAIPAITGSRNWTHAKEASIYMDTVSVGATINTMLAAVRASSRTVIEKYLA